MNLYLLILLSIQVFILVLQVAIIFTKTMKDILNFNTTKYEAHDLSIHYIVLSINIALIFFFLHL